MKAFALAASAAGLLAQVQANQFVMYTGTTASDGDDNCVERADPILAPGTISQHVHQIFGSNSFGPSASYDTLQKSTCTTVGSAGGEQNAADHSIYWHPALFMEAKDGSGFIRVPTLGHKFYYKDAGTGRKADPFEFPKGFRMVGGNAFMRAAATDLQQQNITQWICHSSSGMNQGTAGGFPTGVTDCDAYPGFNGAIHMPHCWDGVNQFDISNPTAHVVYPIGDIENGACPSSHPIRLPHIFAENQFNLHAVVDKVKPDTFTLAMGDPTGYGWHFDFFNGWDAGAIPELINTCPQGQYGNEDIGSCPSFKTTGAKTNSCPLKVTYKENVDTPGQYLPGCNPVQTRNPALFYATVPLGVSSNQCKLFSGGSGPRPTTTKKPTTTAKPTTTMITTKKPPQTTTSPHTQPTSGSGGVSGISCPASNGKTYKVNAKTFKVQCSTDHYGGDLKMVTVHSLGECVQACAMTSGCVDVSLSGVACYMKNTLGARSSNGGVNGAKLISSGGSKHRRHMERHLHKRDF